MTKIRLSVALLACLGVVLARHPEAAAAEIRAPAQVADRDPIVATIDAPSDSENTKTRIAWTLPPGVKAVYHDGKREACLWAAGPGRYTLEALVATATREPFDFTLEPLTITIQVGPAEPPPNPTPPDPPPVVSGRRTVLLVYETGETTPKLSGLITQLRDGQAAAWLAQRGHALWCLDDDSRTPDGLPLPLLAPYRERNPPLPALLILDSAGSVLFAGSVPGTSDAVVELVKKHGG